MAAAAGFRFIFKGSGGRGGDEGRGGGGGRGIPIVSPSFHFTVVVNRHWNSTKPESISENSEVAFRNKSPPKTLSICGYAMNYFRLFFFFFFNLEVPNHQSSIPLTCTGSLSLNSRKF